MARHIFSKVMVLVRFQRPMELHYLDHVARAAAALINSSQVTFAGMASLMRTVRAPSSVLGARLEQTDRIDLLIYENHDPEGCIDLLNETMGEHSSFHHKYGYYLWAQASWEAILPTGWVDRLEYLNYPLARAPHMLAVAPCDTMLANLATTPDPILNMDLMLGGVTTAEKLLKILDQWELPEDKRAAIRSQIRNAAYTLKQIDEDATPNVERAALPLPAGNVVPIMGRGSKRRLHA